MDKRAHIKSSSRIGKRFCSKRIILKQTVFEEKALRWPVDESTVANTGLRLGMFLQLLLQEEHDQMKKKTEVNQ